MKRQNERPQFSAQPFGDRWVVVDWSTGWAVSDPMTCKEFAVGEAARRNRRSS